jgi:conjugative relaxase-like TrwC/TraI family protein
VIATIKVLGLTARDFATIAAAARRVVEYVQGGPGPHPSAGPSGYYAGSGENDAAVVKGKARGTAAAMVGLRASVGAEQLQRVLLGRHAVTGAWLLPTRGSAGRSQAHGHRFAGETAEVPDVLSLTEAARVAGVSPQYLRRLAEDHALVAALTSTADPPGKPTGPPIGHREIGAGGSANPAAALDGSDDHWTPAAGRDHLRARRDLESGRWLVDRGELARFMAEREPPTVVIGFDLTCSAPKSVSLLWAFGDGDLRADIEAALDAGVDTALGYLERYAAVGTVGGKNRPGVGLAAASYRHEISRAEEAHLHVHNIIVNAIPIPLRDEDGHPVPDEHGVARVEWRALDSEVLHAHVKTAGYVGAAALRHELARRRGLTWAPVRNGVAELDGFPRSLLDAFSSRRGEVAGEFAQMVDAGFAPDAATLAAAQRGSRAAKRVLADAEVEAIQRRRLVAAGWTTERVRALAAARDREVAPPTSAEVRAAFDEMVGPGGLTERQPVFTQREVHQHIAGWARDRLDAHGVASLADRFLADPRIVLVSTSARRRRNQDEATYTTTELLETEDALLALCRQGRVDRGGPPRAPVDPDHVVQAIEVVNERLRASAADARLSDEQSELVRQILASADLVRPVVGPAGTGKTEAMRAVVHGFTAAGYTVLATANGGRQAEELHERLEIPAQVVSGWLTRLDHSPDPAEAWPAGTVLIVDEATHVSTRDAERLLRYATRTGTVVVLVGDPVQLGSVGAGGWFRHLVTAAPDVPGLTVNQRQQGPHLAEVRRALTALRSDVPADSQAALRRLAADGRLRLFDTREDLLAAVVDDWYAERRGTPNTRADTASGAPSLAGKAPGGRPRMMAENHRDTDLLNRAARARLAADGTVSGRMLLAAGRDFQAGDEVITLTQQGHTLVPVGRPGSAYIRTGTVGVVTAVHTDPAHPERQAVTVRFGGRGDVRVDWGYLTHAFPDGRDGGLAHAYAVTAHKAEGSTMPTARVVVADDTSRAGLYVMLSRAREDLRAYVVRRRDLEADLDDEDWLPILDDPSGGLRRLADHLARSRHERLASEHDPVAHRAHQMRARHTLAELTELRRAAMTDPAGELDPLLVRRAELAAEATIGQAAVADPPVELLARLGPRPPSGPDRAGWDQAVAALAIYHARHQPRVPRHELGPAPPNVGDTPEQRWRVPRTQAEQLASQWAARLDPTHQHRFGTGIEGVPRHRAVADIHALLDRGWTPDDISASLTAGDLDGVRSGAGVLEHRARRLLDRAGLDATLYEMPAPQTPQEEWHRAGRLLFAAESHHLATRHTGDLAAEHREVTRKLTATLTQRELRPDLLSDAILARDRVDARGSDPNAAPALDKRLRLLDAALAHQIDDAAARLAQEPAPYLVALLGHRPTEPTAVTDWTAEPRPSSTTGTTSSACPTARPSARPAAHPQS